jgi:hypothetical protein
MFDQSDVAHDRWKDALYELDDVIFLARYGMTKRESVAQLTPTRRNDGATDPRTPA